MWIFLIYGNWSFKRFIDKSGIPSVETGTDWKSKREEKKEYLEIKTQHTIQEKKLFQILQLQNFKIQPLIITPSPINISTWQFAGLDQEWSRGAIGNTAQVAHPRDSENNAITTTVTSQPYLPDNNQA